MKQELSNGKLYIKFNNSDDYIELFIKDPIIETYESSDKDQEEYIEFKQPETLSIDLDTNNSITNNQLLNLMVQEYKIRQAKKKLKKTQSKGLHKKKIKHIKIGKMINFGGNII